MRPLIRTADPDSPAAQNCLRAYFALLTTKIPDLPPNLFPLPDPDAQQYRPPDGTFLIAFAGDTPLGCVSLRRLTATTGEVKRLWVAATARGQGLARRLMTDLETAARAQGLTRLNLDTHENLTGALILYQKTGWIPTAAYSGPPSTHWFTKPLS